jgi:uncharacterized protein
VSGDPPVAQRIAALDVLRGIALLGMFLVHFHMFASGPGSWPRLSSAYDWIVANLFEERFWTMFGILFGAGFAVQLRRAEARGASFAVMYLRRIAALAAFGFIAHGIFGFNVLLGYAAWGLPLLLIRRWSIRALIIALALSAMSGAIYSIAYASVRLATVGEQAGRAEAEATMARNQAFNRANRAAQDSPQFAQVVRARLQHMAWFYKQPFSFLPMNTLTLFLLGVIALRLGYFDEPARHRRAITALMVFGCLSWVAEQVMPEFDGVFTAPPIRQLLLAYGVSAFALIRGTWLSFVYIGAVLLLVARDPVWLKRLGAFGWTGRMALTNYMIQIAILDLMFAKYALGLELTTVESIVAALGLFGLNAIMSRWWLTGFRFGPLEWLWRSAAYASWQPWRRGPRLA